MSENLAALSAKLEQLALECDELREEIAHAKRIQTGATAIAKEASSVAIRTPRLRHSLVDWIGSWQSRKPAVPVKETSKVIHAVAGNLVSRKLLIWVLAIVTGLPTLFSMFFLWQQTGFLDRQNQLLLDAGRKRRAVELQGIIREKIDGEKFRFGPRARQVAFVSYLEFLTHEKRLGTIWSAATLSGLSFPTTYWYDVDFNEVRLAQSVFNDAYFERCDLSGVSFFYGDLSKSRFDSCNLRNADLGKFSNVLAMNSDFSGARFSFIPLKNSKFENCNFSGAKFTYFTPGMLDKYLAENAVAFDGAQFVNSDFSGAIFDQNTPVQKAKFTDCTFDEATIFPPEFTPLQNGFAKKAAE